MKFRQTLSRLRQEGVITDDETAAVVASELMEPMLASLDQEFEPDSDSIEEAIERVRQSYREEAVANAKQAVDQAMAQVRTTNELAEEAIRRARSAAAEAQKSEMEAIRKRQELQASIEGRIRSVSRGLSGTVFGLGVVIVVLAALLSVPGLSDSFGGTVALIARAIVAVTTVFGVYRTIYGKNLKVLWTELDDWIAGQLRKRWLSGLVEPVEPQRKAG